MISLPRASQWFRALAETVTAMLICLIASGILFLNRKTEPDKPFCYAGVLAPDRGSFFLIAESWTGQQSKRQLVEACDVAYELPKFRRLLPEIDPICIAAEPNGARLFVSDVDGNVCVVGTDSRTPFFLGHVAKGNACGMACSEDGTTLIVRDFCGLFAWNVDSQSNDYAKPRWYQVGQTLNCFALDPNSKTGIAVRLGPENSELIEFNLRTGELDGSIGVVSGCVHKIVIAPNSRWMVALQDGGAIQLFSRASVELPWQLDRIAGLSSCPSLIARFSADSQLLVTGSSEGDGLIVWKLEQQEVQLQTNAVGNVIVDCEFLDSTHILSWTNVDANLHIWNLHSASPEREFKVSLP